MRVYHFVDEEHGLDDIRRRRLKTATLHELNDPFELLGASLKDAALRDAVRDAKNEFAKDRGFLCFSTHWRNPVQWSHYAAKHSGLCLGFDVPDALVRPITYSRRRFAVDIARLLNANAPDPEVFGRFLFTKFSHWRYESEVRAIVGLRDRDPATNLYFADFSGDLRLTSVIVGAESRVSRQTLSVALGNLSAAVEVFKARLAFRTFRVVRQRDPRQWV